MGCSNSTAAATTPPWDGSSMPSQKGKVAIVTGANSGIGYYTARMLAVHGAHVILACRCVTKGQEAAAEMTEFLSTAEPASDARGHVEFLHLDLSDLASIRRFSTLVHERFGRVDLLINNAGVVLPPPRTTVDGFETHFGVNYLGHFYLTMLLFDLVKAAPSARIVSVGSLSHSATRLHFDTLVHGRSHRWKRYAMSKLAQTMFMIDLDRRMKAAGITHVLAVTAHPGMARTGLSDKLPDSIMPKWLARIQKKVGQWVPVQGADMGALPTVFAATHLDVHGGEYFGPSGSGHRSGYPALDASSPYSHEEGPARRLWELSEELLKVQFRVAA